MLNLRGSSDKSITDKIKSIAYNKGLDVYTFVIELIRLCKITGYNHGLMFAQAWHETGGFTSEVWKNRKNPAGIKDLDGTSYQLYFNGVDAARAFVVHMSAYIPPPNEKALENYFYLDRRYKVAVYANKGKNFVTIKDLTGKWATDPEYGKKIERVFSDIYQIG